MKISEILDKENMRRDNLFYEEGRFKERVRIIEIIKARRDWLNKNASTGKELMIAIVNQILADISRDPFGTQEAAEQTKKER